MPTFRPPNLPDDREEIMRGDSNANEHFAEYPNEAFSQKAEYHPRGGKKPRFDGYSTESSDDEARNERYSVDQDEHNSAEEFTDKITEAAYLSPSDPAQASSKKGNEKMLPAWDQFQVTSRDNFFEDEKQTMDILRKILKIAVAILLIIFVLGCAVISKVTFFMIEAKLNTTAMYLYGGHKNETTSSNIPVQWIWSGILIICFPYILIFLKCFWRLCFKKTHNIRCRTLVLQLVLETVHTLGMVSLVFVVLPRLDIFRGILIMTGVGVVPSVLKIFDVPPLPVNDGTSDQTKKRKPPYSKARRTMAYVIDVLSCVGQVSALIIWPLTEYFNGQQELDVIIILPISLVFISVNWWENYVTKISKDKFFLGALYTHKKEIRKQRTKLNLAICLWKIVLTLLATGTLFGVGGNCLQTFLFRNVGVSTCDLTKAGVSNLSNTHDLTVAFIVAAVNIFSSWLCYLLAKTACKVLLQIPSFALPLILATPCSLIILGSRFSVNWDFGVFPDPSFLDLRNYLDYLLQVHYVPVVVVWFISFLGVVGHIMRPKTERLAQTDKLFVQHLYCGVFVDLSIMLNRRRDEADFQSTTVKQKKDKSTIRRVVDDSDPQYDPMDASHLSKSSTPMIYLCATMWHESENEMLQILKSLFRMDEDQSARRNMQLYFEIPDPDYYEFEAHIFFDDAYEAHTDEEYEYKVNSFVKQLVSCIDIAASAVHRVPIEIGAPIKYPTPYGGRLEWKLVGGNMLVAHLKDKAKIRHRKRWSQVMYMYYFLGHQLLNTKRSTRRMRTKAENTFLLALDGDVDFEPYAVQLLVDRMKKNEKVGAACGRIHPIGSGPMVWYQKFEYAISHWLQKATEHMIGCVLCSPGCFSMFRGSSLMDDNVMARYTTPPSEARHYVQYDQGEDRWLCTLLLQQGYRVEYCAASDALTYAPEGFNEYYNQRRRWTPSTMANILDLLSDWKSVIRLNENISCIYIIYQGFMMVSSILTPGTVFLLILGAINAAFPQVSLVTSLLVNLFPVALFLLLCFVAKGSIQLAYAGVLSGIYSLAMMIVLVGLIIQIAEYLYCSPTALFLAFIVGVFLIAAILHPQEFTCLIFGALYFLAIPSMSMLLMIYSLCNLHVVSWGTREVRQAVAPKQQQQEQGKVKKDGRLQSVLSKVAKQGEVSDYEFSFGNLFKCLCCPKSNISQDDQRFKAILERIDRMEEARTSIPARRRQRFDSDNFKNTDETSKSSAVNFSEAPEYFEGAEIKENPLYQPETRDDMVDPFWIEDPDLRNGQIDKISKEEVVFWNDLIKKYLLPLEGNKEQQAQMGKDLIELRNKVCLFYFLINAIFITIVFTLQYVNGQTQTIAVVIPCGDDNEIILEPISIVFMGVFGFILLIQFIAMIFHRLATFLHIISTVDIRIFRKKADASAVGEIKGSDALDLVRELQRLDTASEEDDTKSIASSVADSEFEGDTLRINPVNDKLFRRFTKKTPTAVRTGTLSKMFQKRMQSLKEMPLPEPDADYNTGELYKTMRKKQMISRKSYKTMITIMQNPEQKKAVQSKWRRFAEMAKDADAAKTGGGPRKSGFSNIVTAVVNMEKAKEKQEMKEQDDSPLEGANGGPEDYPRHNIDRNRTGNRWNNPSHRSTELHLADSSTDFDAPDNLLPGEGLTSL